MNSLLSVAHNFPGGGNSNHQSTQEWTDAFAQEAEASTSLAPTKPKFTENDNQSEVRSVFTPLEIVLYNDGLDSSQVLRLPPALGAGPIAPGPPGMRRRSSSSRQSARNCRSIGQETNQRPFGTVSRLSRQSR